MYTTRTTSRSNSSSQNREMGTLQQFTQCSGILGNNWSGLNLHSELHSQSQSTDNPYEERNCVCVWRRTAGSPGGVGIIKFPGVETPQLQIGCRNHTCGRHIVCHSGILPMPSRFQQSKDLSLHAVWFYNPQQSRVEIFTG